jgi:hypothetical protein
VGFQKRNRMICEKAMKIEMTETSKLLEVIVPFFKLKYRRQEEN